MIRGQSIALAEAIAISVNGNEPLPTKALVAGLNEQSYGSARYNEMFRQELEHVTQNNAHSTILDATSNKLAEVIRGAFDTIKNYGVPFAKTLAGELSVLYTPDRLQHLAFSRLTYNYINVEDPFFQSPIYPVEMKNVALDFSSVSLEMLKRLEFSWPDESDVRDYVNSSHPDVLEILKSTDYSLSDAVNCIGDLYYLQQLFSNNGGMMFNFTVIKSLQINRLLKMYVVLTKMYASEDPVKWLAKGTLADYREFVTTLWNGMTRYLIALKQIANAYVHRTVAIGELEPVGFGAHSNPDYTGARFLAGSVQVFYSNQAMQLLEKNGISFNEWLVAFLYSRFNGGSLEPVPLLSDPIRVKQAANAYYTSINTALTQRAMQTFVNTAQTRAVRYLLETPELKARVATLVPENEVLEQWFTRRMGDEYEKAYHVVAEAMVAAERQANLHVSRDEVSPTSPDKLIQDALLSCSLVPSFLRAVNCNMAATVVESTFAKEEGSANIVDKRQRLHVALIKLIVNNSLGV